MEKKQKLLRIHKIDGLKSVEKESTLVIKKLRFLQNLVVQTSVFNLIFQQLIMEKQLNQRLLQLMVSQLTQVS